MNFDMKYIDAEKMIAVVEQYLSYYRQLNRTRKVFDSVILPLEELLEDITYLQQEQPKFNIPSAGSGAMGTTPPKFKLEVKEQPVEGLEEEIKRMVYDEVYDLDGPAIKGTSEYLSVEDVAFIARHFAEWGRKQVLQEIYEGKVKPVDKITAVWLDDESKAKEDK